MKYKFASLFSTLIVLLFAFVGNAAAPTLDVKITFLDIGQGDAILIQDNAGFTALIDGGKTSAGDKIISFLQVENIDFLDAVVATHEDSDHIGGLIDVLTADNISIGNVYINGYPGDSQTWKDFTTAVVNKGLSLTPLQYPMTLSWGSGIVSVLNPLPNLGTPDQNRASVVLLIDYGDIEVLLTGDIDTTAENHILARGSSVDAEILKVAHHGSNYSSSESFLEMSHPAEAIISVGPNVYGHPASEVLARLETNGAEIWRTDNQGSIVAKIDGNLYTIFQTRFTSFLPIIQRFQAFLKSPYTGIITIPDIYYDGTGDTEPDEYVEIINHGSAAVNLKNWQLTDNENHVYIFPGFKIQPGQICRVYTNKTYARWCSFTFLSKTAIWNNSGDCATLTDAENLFVAKTCYPIKH